MGHLLHTSNIEELLSKIEFHESGLENILSIKPDIIKFDPERPIIHCAWWGGNSYADTNNPNQFHKNLPGAVHLMEILAETKRNVHFIGIGTSAEYGSQETPSETTPEVPVSLYGTSKLMLKMYSERFCRLNDMSWTWLRPFYTYGLGDVATRLIPRTIAACVKREQLRLNSCDSVTDYLYVNDLV